MAGTCSALLVSTTMSLSLSNHHHFLQSNHAAIHTKSPLFHSPSGINRKSSLKLQAIQETKEETKTKDETKTPVSPEQLTEKFGLEYGLYKIFSSRGKKEEEEGGKEKSKTDQAKELLAKFGWAYLATSIFLSIISFSLCYLLVSAGIDVQSFLNKIGFATDETGGKVGTFALAYAAHKAASPIRFPPTVVLTPIVANWFGKKTEKDEK
ncbi:hypothetical protein LUZ60_004169 [Juncus effusus]|nr:hypothetical protein LUZ60_004169 [Juncus effusus]